MITTATKQQIKAISDENIVEVIGDFVSLKKKGATWLGLSPFANERTPSFVVHPAKGIFKDFSSGQGGDAIAFLMQLQGWSFADAIKYLGKKFAIEVDDNDFVYELKPVEIKREIRNPSFIHRDVLLATKAGYENNALYNALSQHIDAATIFDRYQVGCFNDWTIFWQVDAQGLIRSGKYIKYLPTGKRCKETKATWEHAKTVEYKPVYPEFNLVQCFFGEHLIAEDVRKPIAVVEGEKTALVASHYMPAYVWLASGSKMGLNDEKCAVLANRSVTLFPDVGCYDEWKVHSTKYDFNISDKVERMAAPEHKGLDVADFLLGQA